MPMDYYSQLYGKLRAKVLARHFAANRAFRTNFLNTARIMQGKKNKPNSEEDWWTKETLQTGDNPLSIGGMLLTCLSVEQYLGRPDALPIIRAFLETTASLYKFDGQPGMSHFRGYIIRWDPALRDMYFDPAPSSPETTRYSRAFYLNPDWTYCYCTPIHDPRSRRPMTEAEWNAAKPQERDRSNEAFSDWLDRYRNWEPSMDELVGLVAGYDVAYRLLTRRLNADPSAGGEDVLTEIRRQADNLGDYLAEYGYHLVRPGGGFSARGASGALMALEYPFTRVFERITGNPAGSYDIRHGFQWVMERADVWKALEEPFNLYSAAGYALSALGPAFLAAAASAGAGFLFGATSALTAGQLGQVWAIYSHRHVFDVVLGYGSGDGRYNDNYRGEFAFGYALSLVRAKPRFEDWMNGQHIDVDIPFTKGIHLTPGGCARGFAPSIGLTGLDDAEGTVRAAYLNLYNAAKPEARTSYDDAVAVLLQPGVAAAERELVISLNTDLSAEPPWVVDGADGREDLWNTGSRAGTTIERMTATALAWLHRKLIEEQGGTVTTPSFPELPDWNDTNQPWPLAVVPKAVIEGPRSDFPLPEQQGAIQRGRTLATLTRQPDGSADLFLGDHVPARSPVPIIPLFRPAAKPIFDRTITVAEWNRDCPTGLTLNMGDEFEITATGSVWAGDVTIGKTGPNGAVDRIAYDHKFPLTGLQNGHPFCLLGKLGIDGAYFFVGAHWPRQQYLGDAGYELLLRINDDTHGNGSGSFKCRVRAWQANPTAWLYACDGSGKALDRMEIPPTQESATTACCFFVRHNGTRKVTITQVRIEGDGAVQLRAKAPLGPPWVVSDQDWQPIELDFNPQRLGSFGATVVVVSDDPVRPELPVKVFAEVTQPRPAEARLSVSPATLDFGGKIIGSETVLQVVVSNTGNATGYLESVILKEETPAGQFFVPDYMSSGIPVNGSSSVPVAYRPTVKSTATAKAVLRLPAGTQYVEYAIDLRGEGGAPQIRVAPNPLDFGAIPAATSNRMPFRVYNDGNLDLQLDGIDGSPSSFSFDALAFPLVVPPGAFAEGWATFVTPAAPSAALSAAWDLLTNDPDMPRARLQLCGRVGGPRIEVTPEYVEFGRVTTSKTVSVRIANKGSDPLEVTAWNFESGQLFSLTGRRAPTAPLTIAAGRSVSVSILFTMPPNVSSGEFLDRFHIRSNDRYPDTWLNLHAIV